MSRTNANPSAGNAGARQTLSGSSKSATNSRPALSEQDRRRGGRSPRRKGDRGEREIVGRHLALNVHSERVPHSSAMRYRGHGADVDVYAFGPQECPLVSERKSRKASGGFVQLERWLGENDLLFLRRDHAEPLVLLPWRVWAALLAKVRR